MAFQGQANNPDGWATRDGLALFYPRYAAAKQMVVVNTAYPYGWSGWTEITSATLENFLLFGMQLTCKFQIAGITACGGMVQVAIGTVGNEVPIGETAFMSNGGFSITGTIISLTIILGTSWTKWFSPQVIPKGTRISARLRSNVLTAAGDASVAFYLMGYNNDDNVSASYSPYSLRGYLTGTERGQTIVYPDDHDIATNGTAFPAYTAYTEIIAFVPNDTLVTAIVAQTIGQINVRNFYVEIATGAAGVEVSRASAAFGGLQLAIGGIGTLHRPLFVKQGERISFRVSGTAPANIFIECISIGAQNTTTSTTTTSTSTSSTSTSRTTSSTTTTTTSTTTTTTSTTKTTTSTSSTSSSTTRSTSTSSSTSTTTASTSSSTTTL